MNQINGGRDPAAIMRERTVGDKTLGVIKGSDVEASPHIIVLSVEEENRKIASGEEGKRGPAYAGSNQQKCGSDEMNERLAADLAVSEGQAA